MIVDIIIALLVIGYAVAGFRNGAVVGLFSLVGLAGGAYGGTQLAPITADLVDSAGARVIIALLTVVVLALAGQLIMVRIATRIRGQLKNKAVRLVDAVIGAALGAVAVLLVAWMVALPLAQSTIPQVAAQVRQSRVVGAVNDAVPTPVKNTYQALRNSINQSGFPSVFGDFGATVVTDTPAPDTAVASLPIVAQIAGSIVKVSGTAPSCDRGLEGTGFVFSPDHVLTNAHVVAGTTDLRVDAPSQTALPARVVAYNPEIDVAVLYVPGLTAASLAFSPTAAADGENAIVVGYPENGPFDVRAARIRNTLQATGRDIYDENTVSRQIYAIRALVRPGNSGGPLLDTNGQILGIVFAAAVDAKDTGFALTNAQISGIVGPSANLQTPVSTGACAAG